MPEFDKSLTLTTPMMTGQKVKDAQYLLMGHNHFNIKTYAGPLDGVYGPNTATASKKAKYWLGYPGYKIDEVFGQLIYNYLTDKAELPIDYLHRRQERINLANRTFPEKAVDRAITYLGVKEDPPNSNMTKFGAWYGANGVPWCAIFASYCLWEVGYRTPSHAIWRYAYVPYIAQDAARGINGMHFVTEPRKGDLCCYTIDGVKNAHVGFFEKWISEGALFNDIAGNTGAYNLSNGGEVARGKWGIGEVTHFVRLS